MWSCFIQPTRSHLTMKQKYLILLGLMVLFLLLAREIATQGNPAPPVKNLTIIKLPKTLEVAGQRDPFVEVIIHSSSLNCHYQHLALEDNFRFQFKHCYFPGSKGISNVQPGDLLFSEQPLEISVGELKITLPSPVMTDIGGIQNGQL